MSAGRAVVKLRWARGTFTSPQMTPADAELLVESLRIALHNIGDGPAMIGFLAAGGREVDVRAREVVAVEYAPDTPDRQPGPIGEQVTLSLMGGSMTARVVSRSGTPAAPPAPDGTAFLRQQASNGAGS